MSRCANASPAPHCWAAFVIFDYHCGIARTLELVPCRLVCLRDQQLDGWVFEVSTNHHNDLSSAVAWQQPRGSHSTFTQQQRDVLRAQFFASQYPTLAQRGALASRLGLTLRQVNIWFGNRRATHRRRVAQAMGLSSPHH